MRKNHYFSNAGKNEAPSGQKLRIAQVAHLYESVPPKLYGGTERVVAYLTEELIRRGHQVRLFASGDSTARAPLAAGWPVALRLAGLSKYGDSYALLNLSEAYEHAGEFDVIHTHLDYWSFPFSRLVATPTVATMHGRLDLPHLHPIYRHFKEMPLVSISNNQASHLPGVNWVGTVFHGLPRDLLSFNPKGGKYLAFLGRVSPEKRADLAIAIARKVGLPLKIAAKVDEVDRAYFEREIAPLLSPPDIEYIGEITEAQKSEFLGNALALLFPIDWPEPFGLVMIEAMACGTPVIARPCGSVPEIVRSGVTGYVAAELDGLIDAVRKADKLSRETCREEFETRFTADVMARNYERIYAEVIARRRAANSRYLGMAGG